MSLSRGCWTLAPFPTQHPKPSLATTKPCSPSSHPPCRTIPNPTWSGLRTCTPSSPDLIARLRPSWAPFSSQARTLHLNRLHGQRTSLRGLLWGTDGDPSPRPPAPQAGPTETPKSPTSSLPPRVSQPPTFPAPLALGPDCSQGTMVDGAAPRPTLPMLESTSVTTTCSWTWPSIPTRWEPLS